MMRTRMRSTTHGDAQPLQVDQLDHAAALALPYSPAAPAHGSWPATRAAA
ncbi:hypothetical protein GPY61_31915 [Massilia sp. NEAU-DD11]|uniref:Uncharacterized protein n=1 Tax=Massilia cellulosiltytica TaxID=2683234 RepID=A0A7X3G7T8_9BURK|nr:hypothetical protein [Telluria cellulosilytica]MVW64529.1 hypothetical protein [Telluria cellulosilytica]